MPELATSTEIYPTIEAAKLLTSSLPEPFESALAKAFASPSPVDAVVKALEATYAAVKEGALQPALLTNAATAAGQLGFLVLNNHWHSKEQRASDILDAMRKVVEQGMTPADAGGPGVDAEFALAPPAEAPV